MTLVLHTTPTNQISMGQLVINHGKERVALPKDKGQDQITQQPLSYYPHVGITIPLLLPQATILGDIVLLFFVLFIHAFTKP